MLAQVRMLAGEEAAIFHKDVGATRSGIALRSTLRSPLLICKSLVTEMMATLLPAVLLDGTTLDMVIELSVMPSAPPPARLSTPHRSPCHVLVTREVVCIE